jgi:hypothetical protein
MRYFIPLLAFVSLMLGCGGPPSTAPLGSDPQVDPRKTPAVPFRVGVKLSEAARKKLTDSKETIIVSGHLTGHPREGTESKYLDIKSGEVILGNPQQEIQIGETAVFDQLNLNSDAMSRIESQGPHILVYVVSGRRGSKDNLLDCEDYDGQLEALRGRTILIECQLISERFPRSRK